MEANAKKTVEDRNDQSKGKNQTKNQGGGKSGNSQKANDMKTVQQALKKNASDSGKKKDCKIF